MRCKFVLQQARQASRHAEEAHYLINLAASHSKLECDVNNYFCSCGTNSTMPGCQDTGYSILSNFRGSVCTSGCQVRCQHNSAQLKLPPWCRFGIGAIAEGGQFVVNEGAAEAVGATAAELEHILQREQQELVRRVTLYRQGQNHLPVAGL